MKRPRRDRYGNFRDKQGKWRDKFGHYIDPRKKPKRPKKSPQQKKKRSAAPKEDTRTTILDQLIVRTRDLGHEVDSFREDNFIRPIDGAPFHRYSVTIEEEIDLIPYVRQVFDQWRIVLRRHYSSETMLKILATIDTDDGTIEHWFSIGPNTTFEAAFIRINDELRKWKDGTGPSEQARGCLGFEADLRTTPRAEKRKKNDRKSKKGSKGAVPRGMVRKGGKGGNRKTRKPGKRAGASKKGARRGTRRPRGR